MKRLFFTTIILFSLTTLSNAQISEYKILPSEGDSLDEFGNSVSISGNYAIVGSPIHSNNGIQTGSAYIFKRVGNDWLEEQKIAASDGGSSDLFGSSVCIKDEYAIVGATLNTNNGQRTGAAYVFHKIDTTWVEEQKLIAPDGAGSDNFGGSVSISNNYAVVCAKWDDDDGNYSGSVYIFKNEGSNWNLYQKLTASDAAAYDWFGCSVSMWGDYIVIGAWRDDDNGTESGSAYIFQRDSISGIWLETQKIIASDGGMLDKFGFSVSISESFIIVGVPNSSNGELRTGSAYVFRKENLNWVETQKLVAGNGFNNDNFGNSVSISGQSIIISADERNNYTGAAYIFRKSDPNWVEEYAFTASDVSQTDWFGYDVSISGNYAIVGSIWDDDNGPESGSAYIYTNFVTTFCDDSKSQIVDNFCLTQNFPNPFNPATTIKYEIAKRSDVTIKVFGLLGEEVRTLINKELEAGEYEIEFNAKDLPSGVYFYQLRAVDPSTGSGQVFIQTKKMILLK